MTFQQELQKLRSLIETLSSIMDEAEQLEEQKLSVLGFDQDNVLEDEIQYRFKHHSKEVEKLYADIVQLFPSDVANFQINGFEDNDNPLQSFRSGQATLSDFWDLFGE